jgi:2-keto-4-pentenoate hydratase/2-oxohepta-3-ene-1,7-dioic acid hydratase in catechol pathway
MKLLRTGPPGVERPAVLGADGIMRDVSVDVTDYDGDFLARGGIARLRALANGDGSDRWTAVDEGTRIGPCIARPGKIVCVGLNYRDHAAESGMPIPKEPVLFFKAPNTLSGPYDDVRIPPGSRKTDWEVELGAVIGREARYLRDEAAAREVIAGYVVSHDVSEREFQLERGGQWMKGKSCETFNPVGPWLVPADEVPDVQLLDLWLSVNDEVVQQGSTKAMIFSVAHVVWYISQFMVLEPGDLVNTGTPYGVGMGFDSPRYLRAGDVVRLGIDGLGEQRQRFVQGEP